MVIIMSFNEFVNTPNYLNYFLIFPNENTGLNPESGSRAQGKSFYSEKK